MKRWVVREGDGATVREVLARMREDERALADGRVFVGKKRIASGDARVRAGDEVRVGPAVETSRGEGAILFVRDGIAATIKPAGIPTVADHAGASHAFVAVAARALGRRESDLRVTSRLDREVSGVVLFALDAAAEGRLREARARGAYARRYVAIAHGEPAAEHGVWREPIGRGEDARHRAVGGAEGKEAETRFRVVARASGCALLALEPVTGRTHQLRVHVSHHGSPLLGDRDYGGPTRLVLAGGRVVSLARIALHCARVAASGVVAEAPIPEDLARAWSSLGGGAEAWEKATSCALSEGPSS